MPRDEKILSKPDRINAVKHFFKLWSWGIKYDEARTAARALGLDEVDIDQAVKLAFDHDPKTEDAARTALRFPK